jgi:hypothetical protein
VSENPTNDSVLARAREEEWEHEEAFQRYLAKLEEGRVERIAAKATGYGYSTVRGWYEDHKTNTTHRERWERVKDAKAVDIQRRLDENDELPMAIGSGRTDEDAASSGIHPQTAALKMKQNVWRLEWSDPETFLPAKKLEATGKDGGPVKSDMTITLAEAREIAED